MELALWLVAVFVVPPAIAMFVYARRSPGRARGDHAEQRRAAIAASAAHAHHVAQDRADMSLPRSRPYGPYGR